MDWILNPMKYVVVWIIEWITQPAEALLENLEQIFPSMGDELAVLNEYLTLVDEWIDVDRCLQMSSVFIGFWTVLTAYKVIKSWIPTVSGGG